MGQALMWPAVVIDEVLKPTTLTVKWPTHESNQACVDIDIASHGNDTLRPAGARGHERLQAPTLSDPACPLRARCGGEPGATAVKRPTYDAYEQRRQ